MNRFDSISIQFSIFSPAALLEYIRYIKKSPLWEQLLSWKRPFQSVLAARVGFKTLCADDFFRLDHYTVNGTTNCDD